MDTTQRPKYLDNRSVEVVDRWSTWGKQGLPQVFSVELKAGLTHTPHRTTGELADDLVQHLEHDIARRAVDGYLAAPESWEERPDRLDAAKREDRRAAVDGRA